MNSIGSSSTSKVSILQQIFRIRHLFFDVMTMVLVIGGVSLFLRRFDPAWLQINPSPWLLIPLLIGFRYGFWPGINAGAIAAISSGILALLVEQGGIFSVFAKHAVHYASFLGVGGVAGFARYLLTDRTSELEQKLAVLEEDLQRKDSALSLYRENEIQLKQSLLLHNAEFVSLSDELVEILKIQDDKESVSRLLAMLQNGFGIFSCAIYVGKDAKSLQRVAVAGSEEALPDTVKSREPMIHLAQQKNAMVTCKHLWDSGAGNTDSPYLAVIPMGGVKSLLVIHRMKLESINWDNFGRIESILNYWGGGRGRSHRVEEGEFNRALDTAIKLRDDLGVPGYVVQFEKNNAVADSVANLAMPGYYSELASKLCVIVLDGKNSAASFGDKVARSLNDPSMKYDILTLESAQNRTGQ